MSDGKCAHGPRQHLKQGLQCRGYGEDDQGVRMNLYEVGN